MRQHEAELRRLVQQALTSPPWVSQLESQNWHVVEIQREPEAGIRVRLVSGDPELGADSWLALVVDAADARPVLYPSAVPFIPGTGAVITRVDERVTVAWHPSGPFACDLPISGSTDLLTNVAERLREVGEGMRPDDPVSQARAVAGVRAVFDSLDPDTRTQLETTLASLRPAAAVEAEYESLFAAAIEASKNDGWEIVTEKGKETPVRSRKVKLERGFLIRTVFMLAMSGGSVLLRQERLDRRSVP